MMKRQFLAVLAITSAIAILLGVSAVVIGSPSQSTHLVIGVALSWVNILFYAFVAHVILNKKNIAWAMTMIVIKYLILVSVLYYIWASADVVIVLVGVFSQLVLTAISFIPLKRFVLS